MKRALGFLILWLPVALFAGSQDVRNEDVSGRSVATMNDNFRRLDQEKMSKSQVQALITSSTNEAEVLVVYDEKAAGTSGGTFTAGGWYSRTLNTTEGTITGGSVAGSTITLPAGTYLAYVSAPAYRVGRHQAVLRNTTNNSDAVRGGGQYSGNSTDYASNNSTGWGSFTLTDSATFQVWHRCEFTYATRGFGVEGVFTNERYTSVTIIKIGG